MSFILQTIEILLLVNEGKNIFVNCNDFVGKCSIPLLSRIIQKQLLAIIDGYAVHQWFPNKGELPPGEEFGTFRGGKEKEGHNVDNWNIFTIEKTLSTQNPLSVLFSLLLSNISTSC